MNSTEIKAFYEEHKHKKGKDFRLEVLKLSKEDMYDFLDHIHQDNVHGWRILLQEKEIENERLKKFEEEYLKENPPFSGPYPQPNKQCSCGGRPHKTGCEIAAKQFLKEREEWLEVGKIFSDAAPTFYIFKELAKDYYPPKKRENGRN